MKRFCLILCAVFISIIPVFGQPVIDGFLYFSHKFEREKDYRAAIAEIDKAIELQPGNASLYLKKGRLYANLKDKNAALENLLIAVSLKPDDINFLEFCAAALNLSGNFEESLKIAERLLAVAEKISLNQKPTTEQRMSILTGYRIRYKTRFLLEDYHAAIEDIIKSGDLIKAYWEGRETKVDAALFITSETEGLLEKTLHALKDDPKIFGYYNEIFRILEERRKTSFISNFMIMTLNEPVTTFLYADYAALFEKNHTKAETAALFDRYAKDLGIYKRVEIYKKLEKYELALKDLDTIMKSIRDKSGKSSNIVGRGNIYFLMNQYEKAISEYEKAKKIYQELNYEMTDLDEKIAEAKRRLEADRAKTNEEN